MSDDVDERAAQRVGTVLNDKWTLERLIGIGGMAAVYAGLHRNGARAAIKVLHPAYARRSEVKDRFLREGYAANKVNHSGVVKVLDDDEIEGGPDAGGAFLVMELLEGQSLEDRLEKGPPIPERELLPIVRAVLDVLESAHKAGVIHRDLKPENLFLARDTENPSAPARIKILDFGLARIAEGGKTMAGMAIGTPSYMPPEQAAGRVLDIDARSDLFAVGAWCFRILAGRTVHPAEGAFAICARMAKEPAPKLRSVAPDVSPKTAAAIDRALAFRRDDRWPDAAAMRDAIDDAIFELGGDVIQIESGMIEVVDPSAPAPKRGRSQAVEVAPPLPPPSPPRVEKASEPSEPSEPAKPIKRSSSSFFVWIVVLVLLGVGVKVAIDRFGLLSLLDDQAAQDDAQPVKPVVAQQGRAESVTVPVIDVRDAVSEHHETASIDAAPETKEAEATDADIEDALPSMWWWADAEPLHLGIDAGAHHPTRHDAGAHHPHGPRHHK